MYVKEIIDVCYIRNRAKLNCRDCQYYGTSCNHTKKILKVSRPSEYYITNDSIAKQEENENGNQ